MPKRPTLRKTSRPFPTSKTICARPAASPAGPASRSPLSAYVNKMATRRDAAVKAWKTRRVRDAFTKARAAEAASKEALRVYCGKHRWRVAFLEGPKGGPRTGIIDAVMFRLSTSNADLLDVRLVQLKGGKSGISASEI